MDTLHWISLLPMATLKLSVFWSSRKLTSLRGGASALPRLTIFHSLSALHRWQVCTRPGHRQQQSRRCCIPAQPCPRPPPFSAPAIPSQHLALGQVNVPPCRCLRCGSCRKPPHALLRNRVTDAETRRVCSASPDDRFNLIGSERWGAEVRRASHPRTCRKLQAMPSAQLYQLSQLDHLLN